MRRGDTAAMQKYRENGAAALSDETKAWIDRTWTHLKRAKELAPKNPREPWVEAVIWYNVPPERGGSQEKAIAMYRDAVALARAERVSDPLLPDWGEPEALMSLSYSLLHRAPPDWYYVREVLRPQIQEALHAKPAKN